MGVVALQRIRPKATPRFDSLAGWWTGDQVTIDTGTAVRRMLDLSGRGNHLTQTTLLKQPLQVVGGLNAHNTVLFDGIIGVNGDQLSNTLYLPNKLTAYMVVKPIAWVSGRTLFDSVSGSPVRIRMISASPKIDSFSPTSTQVTSNTPMTLGAWHIVQLVVNQEESFLKVDDGEYLVGSFTNTSNRGISIGSIGAGILGSNIEVAEVIVQHKATGEAERNVITNYLKAKYALAFAAPTTFFSGWKEPTTFANDPLLGTELWQNMGNAEKLDGAYSTVLLSDITPDSQYLKAMGYGFAIPGGATITGIVAQISRNQTGATDPGTYVIDGSTAIVKAGALTGNDLGSGTTFPIDMNNTIQYGNNTELWGEAWTPADINDPGFGIGTVAGMGFTVPSSCTARIDRIRMGVYYQ